MSEQARLKQIKSPCVSICKYNKNNLQYKTFVGNGDTESKNAYLIKEELLLGYAYKIINYG